MSPEEIRVGRERGGLSLSVGNYINLKWYTPLVWSSAQDFYLMEAPENLLVLQSQMYFEQKKY